MKTTQQNNKPLDLNKLTKTNAIEKKVKEKKSIGEIIFYGIMYILPSGLIILIDKILNSKKEKTKNEKKI